jgi:hypothetical protein
MHEKGFRARNFERICKKIISIEASCQNGDTFKTAVAQNGVSSSEFLCVSCILLMSSS